MCLDLFLRPTLSKNKTSFIFTEITCIVIYRQQLWWTCAFNVSQVISDSAFGKLETQGRHLAEKMLHYHEQVKKPPRETLSLIKCLVRRNFMEEVLVYLFPRMLDSSSKEILCFLSFV